MKGFKIIAVAVVLLVSASSFAGGIDLTIGGGLNMSNMTMTKDYELPSGVDKGMLIGFNAGANCFFPFADKMGLVAGLNYETRGTKITSGDYTDKVTANYLQIPILFSYKVMPELAINIGPEFGIFLSGKSKATMGSVSEEADLKDVSTLDLGASIQVTYTIANMIVVGAGYDYGFLNTDNATYTVKPSGSVTNNNIKIFVGYLLHL